MAAVRPQLALALCWPPQKPGLCPEPLQNPPAPSRPHSRQDTGALELPPGAGLIVRLDEALDAILHHTAHAACHHVGTPVPAGGKGSWHTPGMCWHGTSPQHTPGIVLPGPSMAHAGHHLGTHCAFSWHTPGIIPAQSSHWHCPKMDLASLQPAAGIVPAHTMHSIPSHTRCCPAVEQAPGITPSETQQHPRSHGCL